MNRKSFLASVVMAIGLPFLPKIQPTPPVRELPKKPEWVDKVWSLAPNEKRDLCGLERQNPEVIAPLDHLKIVLRGDDMKLANSRIRKYRDRLK